MSTWTTRTETPEDIPAIRRINREAFPTAEEADLVDALRAGAGAAAIRAALDAARTMGEKLVLVLGHADCYPRFGFTPASEFGIHAPFDVPDEAMMALLL